jgi:acyl-CoA synthetase (AMP-forming)/AMP-acid ligase II
VDTIREVLEGIRSERVKNHLYLNGFGEERIASYADVYERAAAFGRRLLGSGLNRGDRVGLVLTEPEEFCCAFLGSILAGVVPVPLYPPLALGRLDAWMASTGAMLARAEARLLVTTPDLRRLVFALVERVATLTDVVAVGQLEREVELPRPDATRPDDLCFLQFTSGSTAAPKGEIGRASCRERVS